MKKLGLLSFSVLACSAQAIMFDDFSTGDFSQSINSGSWVGSQLGTMFGGERDGGITMSSNPLNTSLSMSVTGGQLTATAGDQMNAAMAIEYDGIGDETDNVWPNTAGLALGDTDVASFGDRFRFNLTQTSGPITVLALVTDYRAGGDRQSGLQFVLPSGTSGSVDLLFADFQPGGSIPPADFTQTNRILFAFFTTGGSFTMDSIEIVPEPATMAVLGLGVLAIARGRRRNGK